MGLQENMAATIRAVMEKENKSLSEFSEELGISRTALYDYIRAKGNPSAATIEHIAERMGISAAALVSDHPCSDQTGTTLLLLGTIQEVAKLPKEDRLRFAELFLEMMRLWAKD
ncbi:MAG: helix-turn-helix domain-containing protein [Oscillospiraceae bacterium]|nr:helix-turn-helix domain-containing protein [Oscillospiraceae bacterium]